MFADAVRSQSLKAADLGNVLASAMFEGSECPIATDTVQPRLEAQKMLWKRSNLESL